MLVFPLIKLQGTVEFKFDCVNSVNLLFNVYSD